MAEIAARSRAEAQRRALERIRSASGRLERAPSGALQQIPEGAAEGAVSPRMSPSLHHSASYLSSCLRHSIFSTEQMDFACDCFCSMCTFAGPGGGAFALCRESAADFRSFPVFPTEHQEQQQSFPALPTVRKPTSRGSSKSMAK